MKTFRLIGMVLITILISVNFVACSSDDEEKDVTDLKKIIIGTWVQDGDDDIMVIKPDGTVTWYEDEFDYKNKEISAVYQWKVVNNTWLKFYYEGRLIEEMRPQEVKVDMIIWKRYNINGHLGSEYDIYDSYGSYDLWTWERYNK